MRKCQFCYTGGGKINILIAIFHTIRPRGAGRLRETAYLCAPHREVQAGGSPPRGAAGRSPLHREGGGTPPRLATGEGWPEQRIAHGRDATRNSNHISTQSTNHPNNISHTMKHLKIFQVGGLTAREAEAFAALAARRGKPWFVAEYAGDGEPQKT